MMHSTDTSPRAGHNRLEGKGRAMGTKKSHKVRNWTIGVAAGFLVVATIVGTFSDDDDAASAKPQEKTQAEKPKSDKKAEKPKDEKKSEEPSEPWEGKYASSDLAGKDYLRTLDEIADDGTFTFAEEDSDELLTAMGWEACDAMGKVKNLDDDVLQAQVDKYAQQQGLTEYQSASIFGAAVHTLCHGIGDDL